MADVVGTATPAIYLDGTELSDDLFGELTELRVSKSTGAAGAAMMRFNNAANVGPSFKVGAKIEVAVVDSDSAVKKVFFGEVMSIGIDIAAGRSELHVVAYDASLKLGREIVYDSHMNKSPADVIREMAKAAGMQAVTDDALGTTLEHLQQSATPHEFLSHLAHVYGCEWFVDDNKLNVQRRVRGAAIELSGELRSFSVRITASDEAKDIEVRGWNPATQTALSGVAQPTGKTALNTLDALAASRAKVTAKRAIAWPIATQSDGHAKEIAKGLNARMEASMVSGSGELDVDARITPGALLAIAEVVPDWDGEYYVTSVEHVFGNGQPFVTRFKIGGTSPTTLVDLFSPRTSNRASSATRITSGVTIGIVTNIDDEENLGRVKVNLPYLSDDNETDWARVVQLGAGDQRGLELIPEVQDEVLVAFEHGELQRPFIIGGLFSEKYKPSTATAVANSMVKDRSLTTREGHHITLSDGPDAADQSIMITLRGTGDGKAKTAKLFMSEEKVELIAKGIPVEVKTTDANIILTETGDITLKGKTITLDAETDITIKGNNVKVDAKVNADVKAGASMKLKASAGAELDGGATADIKGGMVNIN